jgi:hypothetical protein
MWSAWLTLKLVTFSSPVVGNAPFAEMLDDALGVPGGLSADERHAHIAPLSSFSAMLHSDTLPAHFRVTISSDPITTVKTLKTTDNLGYNKVLQHSGVAIYVDAASYSAEASHNIKSSRLTLPGGTDGHEPVVVRAALVHRLGLQSRSPARRVGAPPMSTLKVNSANLNPVAELRKAYLAVGLSDDEINRVLTPVESYWTRVYTPIASPVLMSTEKQQQTIRERLEIPAHVPATLTSWRMQDWTSRFLSSTRSMKKPNTFFFDCSDVNPTLNCEPTLSNSPLPANPTPPPFQCPHCRPTSHPPPSPTRPSARTLGHTKKKGLVRADIVGAAWSCGERPTVGMQPVIGEFQDRDPTCPAELKKNKKCACVHIKNIKIHVSDTNPGADNRPAETVALLTNVLPKQEGLSALPDPHLAFNAIFDHWKRSICPAEKAEKELIRSSSEMLVGNS